MALSGKNTTVAIFSAKHFLEARYRVVQIAVGIGKIMRNQEKFFDLPTEPAPLNRRIYAAAKAPFRYMWEFVAWAGKPWLIAAPFAFFAAAVVTLMSKVGVTPFPWVQAGADFLVVGLVWTAYLGAAVALLLIVRSIFK